MSGELGTVWIMHFDMVHSFLQNYVPLNRYGMKFVFMRTEQPTAPSWNSETTMWQPPEVNHVPYDAEILWTYIWNWMSGKTDLYETDRPDTTLDVASAVAGLKADDPNARMKAANELGFMRTGAQRLFRHSWVPLKIIMNPSVGTSSMLSVRSVNLLLNPHWCA